MKLKAILILQAILFVNLIFPDSAIAVKKLPGQWSFTLSGNYNGNFGVSPAMNGSYREFMDDLSKDYNNSNYPFGDGATITTYFGGALSYRFPESNLSIYACLSSTFFYLEKDLSFFESGSASMLIIGFTPGVEYSFGGMDDLWNGFARLGIRLNTMGGRVEYYSDETSVTYSPRIGIEAEAGGRVNIPATPLSVELSVAYNNANLIGKSYEEPGVSPPATLDERSLNDAKNPDNPNDEARVIDFLSLRIGLKIWF